jgi:hypothetical protein
MNEGSAARRRAARRASEPAADRGWIPIAAMAGTVAVLGLVVRVGFVDRSDYAGHFLAGAGATAMLVALVTAFAPGPRPGLVVALCLGAVALGAVCEETVFRLAAFDWVDLSFQSSGAVLACLPFLAGGGGRRSDTGFAVGAVLLIAGGSLALG